MSIQLPPKNSLVLYKNRPARVISSGERLEIETENGLLRVRPKDIILLHSGPLPGLNHLRTLEGDIELVWQMLRETEAVVTLEELASLVFNEYTPHTAWSVWQWVADGLYFQGAIDAIHARPLEAVQREQHTRARRAAEIQRWQDFLHQVRLGQVDLTNYGHFLRECEDLANGRRESCRLLRELGRGERPVEAHRLLLDLGVWSPTHNPYPTRMGVAIQAPTLSLPPLPEESRLDLTDLIAFAIDDTDNQDPDDAISLVSCIFDEQKQLQSARLWVHVADPAALIQPDDPLDQEARARGATLYLPEGAVSMLPPAAVDQFGLGLQQVSPALSFELELNQNAEPRLNQAQPSWVHVQRLSYDEVDQRITEQPFHNLNLLAQAYEKRRQSQGALSIDLPEVILRVVEGQVTIRPFLRSLSRALVREAMLMAGEAVARFAIDQQIPYPYTIQEGADRTGRTGFEGQTGLMTLSNRFGLRRLLRRSQVSSHPAPHAGLGLAAYCRATSPLRRYHDLLAHQQLRQFLQGKKALDDQGLLRRLGDSEQASARISQTEALSRRHWTLVHLLQNPDWEGEAVLVEVEGTRAIALLPDLAYETTLHLRAELPPDSHVRLHLRAVNLPELEAHFVLA